MADRISDPRLETLLRAALSAEVANLPVTVQPHQILGRAETRRNTPARSRLRVAIFGEPTSGLRQLSVAMGAIAVLAVAGALALATLRLDRTNVAAPLPTAPGDWSRVVIDAGPNTQNVTRIAASPNGLLAVVDVEDGPAELFASTDGQSWTEVSPDAHPAIGRDGAAWALVGTDRGFLLSNGDIWSSADGVDWELIASRTDNTDLGRGEMLAVAAGGPGYVGVGSGNNAWYSTDGSNWSMAQVPPPPTEFFESQGFAAPEVAMRGIAVAGDRLVAIGTASRHTESTGLTAPVVWTSRDGRTWSNAVDPLDGEGPSAVAAGPGGFAAMTDEGGRRVVRVSADGSTWEQVADLGAARPTGADGTPLDLDVSAIAASDAGFVAAGGFGPRCLMAGVPCGPDEAVIWTSADGRSWSRLPNADLFARAGASDVVSWGDQFVVGGTQDGHPAIWISGAATGDARSSP